MKNPDKTFDLFYEANTCDKLSGVFHEPHSFSESVHELSEKWGKDAVMEVSELLMAHKECCTPKQIKEILNSNSGIDG